MGARFTSRRSDGHRGVGMGIVRADHLTNLVSIDEVTADHWHTTIGVNLMGAWSL